MKVRPSPPKKRGKAIQTLRLAEPPAQVEEAPVVVTDDAQHQPWDQALDDLFQELREHPPPSVCADKTDLDDPVYCPLHQNGLTKKVSQKGWEYTRCDVKNCPIWLPWDKCLTQILMEIRYNMHPMVRQGLVYCFCEEVCKVGLTKKAESPNVGRCFLTCAQKNAERPGCQFFQWIDQDWCWKNGKFQKELCDKCVLTSWSWVLMILFNRSSVLSFNEFLNCVIRRTSGGGFSCPGRSDNRL